MSADVRRKRKLVLRWGRASRWGNPDWVYEYPDYAFNGRLLHALVTGAIGFPEFARELEARGYDTTTLRLSVSKRPEEAC